MKILALLPVLALAVFAPAASAAATADASLFAPAILVPGDVRYPVRLDIDAEGVVSTVDSGDAVPDTLRSMVERAAARARFEPAMHGDVAVPARAWVTVRVAFEAAGERVRARVAAVTPGGGVQLVNPTRTPMGTRARGYSADVWVRATFDARGRLVGDQSLVERVDVRADDHVEPYPRLAEALGNLFGKRIERTMDDWTWTPDEIDGRKIGGTFRMPVGFPSARASMLGQELAPESPDAIFVPTSPAGMKAPKMLAWQPLPAAGTTAAGASSPD